MFLENAYNMTLNSKKLQMLKYSFSLSQMIKARIVLEIRLSIDYNPIIEVILF